MNFKLVYTVTSTANDCYLEQALLSIYSAKHHMPDAKIALVVDDGTEATLTGHRRNILDYVDEFVSVPFDSKYSKKIRSRLLKTNLRNYIKGDFLYIDCDTIVCGDLSGLDCVEAPVSAVLNRHCLPHQNPRSKRLAKKLKTVGGCEAELYFNGGVMLVKESEKAYEFYTTWNRNYIKNMDNVWTDQSTLALTQQQLDFRLNILPGEYNCQIENGIRYIRDMKIMHYNAAIFTGGRREFLSSFQDSSLYDELKTTGRISDQLKELALHPELSLAECAYLFPPSPLFATRMFNQLRGLFRNIDNAFVKAMIACLKFSVTIASFLCPTGKRSKSNS